MKRLTIILLVAVAFGSVLGCDENPAQQATAKQPTYGPPEHVPAHVRMLLNTGHIPQGLTAVYDPENGNTVYILLPFHADGCSIFVMPPTRPAEKPEKK